MKGDIQPDHIPVNKYQLLILGLPPMVFTEVGGIEQEISAIDLPDDTVASGGKTRPVEFTVSVPEHHIVEQAAMESWFAEGQDPVSPTYKKSGTLIKQSGTGNILRTYSIVDAWVSRRATPDLDMANDGDMATTEYTIRADDLKPI